MFAMDFMGYRVEQVCANVYRAFVPGDIQNGLFICFTVEGVKNGGRYVAHFKISSVTKNNRCYTSHRYHYKYMILIREISFELLKRDMLWDYNNQCPALYTPLD